MTTIFHFSDFHILPEKGMTRDEGDPCSKIEKIIDIARATEIKPSFSIITGDISQNGSTSGYKIAKEYISEIEALGGPVIPVMGNVDNRQRFRENLLNEGASEFPCYYRRKIDGVRVIVLDSHNPREHTGILDEEQLDWLETELSVDTDPTLIALHHPPFALPLPNGGFHVVFELKSMTRFQAIVEQSNVSAVLCGHLHQSLFHRYNGIQYLVSSAALSEGFIGMDSSYTYASSGFNQYTLRGGQIVIRPIIYSDGRKLITKKLF